MGTVALSGTIGNLFQYRKRYGLHAIGSLFVKGSKKDAFQYRKRYGLHAITNEQKDGVISCGFQYRKRYGLHAIGTHYFVLTPEDVSIPQAVWIACNSNK